MFKSREEFVAFVNDFNVLTQEHIDQAVQLKWLKQQLHERMSHACISPEYVVRLEQRVRDLEGWPEIACQQALDRQSERTKTAKRMRALREKYQAQSFDYSCDTDPSRFDWYNNEIIRLRSQVEALEHDAINDSNEKLRLEAAIEAYSDMETDYMSLRSRVILSPEGLK